MAITITATLDASGVKTGATQAANAVDGLKSAGETAGDSLQNMASDPIDELARLAAETGDLKTAIKLMGDSGSASLGRVEAAAESTGAAMRAAGDDISTGVTAASSAFSATMAAVDKIKQGLEAAVRGVNALADDGNAGAMELQGAFGQVHERLLEAFNDPGIQKALVDIAGLVENVVLPAIDLIPDAFFKAGKAASQAYVRFQVLTHQMTEDQAALFDQMLGYADRGMEIARKAESANRQARLAKQREAAFDKELADIAYEKSKRGYESRLAEVDSVEQLSEAISEVTANLKREASQGKLTDESRRSGIDSIRMLEDRLAQLREGHGDADRRSSEGATDVERKGAEERERIAHGELDTKGRLAQEEVQLKQRAEAAKVDAERRAIEERKRLLGGNDVNGAKGLIDAQAPLAREAIARQRAAQAEAAARQKIAKNFDDDDPAAQKRLEAQLSKERKRAVAVANRQFDRGQVDPAEMRAAQEGLAGAAVNAAQKQGDISKATAQALREGIQELARTQNELELVRGEVTNIQKLVKAVTLQGQRMRGQNAGARQ